MTAMTALLPSGAAWRIGWLVLSVGLLGGCSSLPKLTPEEREPKAAQAIPLSPDTLLGRIATESQPSKQLSGFRLMPLGLFSLDTRVQLAKRAQVSLDV